jgi:Protein kinase domain.
MMTGVGVILGTAAYMSPEQATGRSADKRSDVWAFGCVLFEMLTGRSAFGGETVTDTLASVMRDTPGLEKLPAATPPRIRLLIARCLERDSRRRLRDIGDARLELESRSEAEDALAVQRDSRAGWRRSAASLSWRSFSVRWSPRRSLGHSTFRGSAIAAGRAFHNRSQSGTSARSESWPEESGDFARWTLPSVSRSSRPLRPRARSTRPQLLPGTRGAAAPFFSPDGRWVGFFLAGDLKKAVWRAAPSSRSLEV